MTAPAGATAPSNGLQSASAAAARVAELQALIARVERGGGTPHASVGAELASASAPAASPGSAMAGASSLPMTAPLASGVGATGVGAPGVGPTGAPTSFGSLSPSTPFAAQIEAAAGRHRGLALCGSAYHGVGIPHCIHSGEQAAERMLTALSATS